ISFSCAVGKSAEPVVVVSAVDAHPKLRVSAPPLPAARAGGPDPAPGRLGPEQRTVERIGGEHVEGGIAARMDRSVAVEAGARDIKPGLNPRAVRPDSAFHVQAQPDAP